MGNRATLVMVDGGEPDIRYGHWAANDLSNHLVLGPVWTERFVRHHPSGEWLDDAWTEGGLAMDLEKRTLVWFDNLTAADPLWRDLAMGLLSLMHSHRAYDLPELKALHSELEGPPLDAIFLNRPYAQPTPSSLDLRRLAEHLHCFLAEAT
ncbi:MAG: hypothetical protein ACT4QG_15205 [Sporichthyaceae bacterium]